MDRWKTVSPKAFWILLWDVGDIAVGSGMLLFNPLDSASTQTEESSCARSEMRGGLKQFYGHHQ